MLSSAYFRPFPTTRDMFPRGDEDQAITSSKRYIFFGPFTDKQGKEMLEELLRELMPLLLS